MDLEKNKWKYYSPTFEFTKKIPLSIDASPWGGHSFFAYDLVANTKPKVIVELGTYKGNSLFAFAQAVKDLNLQTELHAIDTWEGDIHSGFYKNDIYELFIEVKNKYYKNLNITPHKMLFDDAIKNFEDNSIDILHIDGLHTYEAVKHDFETWLPKVNKDTGIIIFHDVCETKDDFGVYKLWGELRDKYSSFTIKEYHGLGILSLKKNFFDKDQSNLEKYYNLVEQNLLVESEIEKVKNEQIALKEQYASLELEKKKLLNDNKDLADENTNLINENKNLTDENTNLINENKDLADKNTNLINENKNLSSENISLHKKTNQMHIEVEEFRSFKKGRIWKTLEKYRKIKTKVKRK